jgi:hypothetical protein
VTVLTGVREATVRTAGRACVVLLAAVSGAVLGPLPAYADTATPHAVKTNWYWFLQTPTVEGETLPVGAPAEASLVPAGDLGVGYLVDQLSSTDKVAAVDFDLGEIPQGSTYSSFRVTVPYDPAAQQVTTGTPDISACELLDAFQDAPGPSDLAKAPPLSLPSCVKGTFKSTIGAAGGYEFDLTAMANDWSGGAPQHGILIRPTPSLTTPQQPFSISLQGKNGITTKAEYTPPQPTTPPVAPGPVLPPAPQLPGVVLPPVTGVGQVPAPTVPQPEPQVNPLPKPQTAPLAAAYHEGALVPSGAWWLGLLGLLGLLVLTAAVLGDPLAPVAIDPRRRRFAGVVRAQTRAAASSPARRPAPRFRPA